MRVEPGPSLEIVVSMKGATVTGVLRDNENKPLSGVRVTVWPKTPDEGSTVRGVRTTGADQEGAFRIGGLPPGEYYAAAWEDLDNGLAHDPGFLERFADRAASIQLAEGAQKSADIKMIPKDATAAEAAKLL